MKLILLVLTVILTLAQAAKGNQTLSSGLVAQGTQRLFRKLWGFDSLGWEKGRAGPTEAFG